MPFFVSPDDAASKQEVLKAALHLFVHKGMCETTIRDIADESGYSNPVLFKFFESKDALALYLFERCYRHLAEVFDEAVGQEARFPDALRSLIARYGRMLDEHPEAFLFVQENLRQFWPRLSQGAKRMSLIARLRVLFERGRKQGIVTTGVDLDLLVAAFSGLMGQFARMRYFGEFRGTVQDWTEAVYGLATGMLR